MIFVLILISISSAKSLLGVDISQLHSLEIMKCFIEEGRTFIIPRAWKSINELDGNFYQNMVNAYEAGMSRVDVYFLPCWECGDVRGQVTTFWDTISGWEVSPTRVWLDIEGEWSSVYSENIEFFEALINQVRSIGFVHGIYCSLYYWKLFFGLDYIFRYHSETQLWYVHYNSEASFDGYSLVSFGGWEKPNLKQYQANTAFCGGFVDFNYEEQ